MSRQKGHRLTTDKNRVRNVHTDATFVRSFLNYLKMPALPAAFRAENEIFSHRSAAPRHR